jgi:membrane-associated PAP2 superfamily phosphatase
LRILVYVLIGVVALATIVSLVGLNVDLALAAAFYEPSTHRFVAFDRFPWVREPGWLAVSLCVGINLLSLARFLPWRLPTIPPRSAIALTLSLMLGPGLLVNGILKPHGGRPRPASVTEFGGQRQFVNWWDPNGTCPANCSFMSGEVSTVAWLFGPAMLVPMPMRTAAIVAAGLFTATVGILRMAAGGHFFSDVLWGALATILIILALNRLIVGRRSSG